MIRLENPHIIFLAIGVMVFLIGAGVYLYQKGMRK